MGTTSAETATLLTRCMDLIDDPHVRKWLGILRGSGYVRLGITRPPYQGVWIDATMAYILNTSSPDTDGATIERVEQALWAIDTVIQAGARTPEQMVRFLHARAFPPEKCEPNHPFVGIRH